MCSRREMSLLSVVAPDIKFPRCRLTSSVYTNIKVEIRKGSRRRPGRAVGAWGGRSCALAVCEASCSACLRSNKWSKSWRAKPRVVNHSWARWAFLATLLTTREMQPSSFMNYGLLHDLTLNWSIFLSLFFVSQWVFAMFLSWGHCVERMHVLCTLAKLQFNMTACFLSVGWYGD